MGVPFASYRGRSEGAPWSAKVPTARRLASAERLAQHFPVYAASRARANRAFFHDRLRGTIRDELGIMGARQLARLLAAALLVAACTTQSTSGESAEGGAPAPLRSSVRRRRRVQPAKSGG